MHAFPLTVDGVLLQIERLRGEAGRDRAKLATLAQEMERHLRAAAPEDPFLAAMAHKVLDGYLTLAQHGFFPEISRDEEL